jgi:hypothetical protein
VKFSPAQIQDIRARQPVNLVAGDWVSLRHGSAKFGTKGFTGPCPLHSKDPAARDSTSFECDGEGWVCASCADGGDVFKLVALRNGMDPKKDFVQVVEILGGVREIDPETARKAEEARAAEQLESETERNEWRERERGRAYDAYYKYAHHSIWGRAGERYLHLARGLDIPPGVWLRFDPAARFYVPDKPKYRLIHTGPALLAQIQRGGKFQAVHITWLDPALNDPDITRDQALALPAKGKAVIVDPKTGERFGAKKMFGSKKGGHIDLTGCTDPRELVLGEGIEKVLAVYSALADGGRDIDRAAFWSAADLGNLGGKHAELVAHPTLKTKTGRAQRVPGPDPDTASPAIEIPASVERLVLLGDSTSDRFSTECVMARAAARYARPGLAVVTAWAPDGKDFDDLLREVG